MKHAGVIFFTYLLSILLLNIPAALEEWFSLNLTIIDMIGVFIYISVFSFPLVLIYFTLLHGILFQAKKRDWFRPGLFFAMIVGLGLSVVYLVVIALFGVFDNNMFWLYPLTFSWMAVIYHIGAIVRRRMNWWTL